MRREPYPPDSYLSPHLYCEPVKVALRLGGGPRGSDFSVVISDIREDIRSWQSGVSLSQLLAVINKSRGSRFLRLMRRRISVVHCLSGMTHDDRWRGDGATACVPSQHHLGNPALSSVAEVS